MFRDRIEKKIPPLLSFFYYFHRWMNAKSKKQFNCETYKSQINYKGWSFVVLCIENHDTGILLRSNDFLFYSCSYMLILCTLNASGDTNLWCVHPGDTLVKFVKVLHIKSAPLKFINILCNLYAIIFISFIFQSEIYIISKL